MKTALLVIASTIALLLLVVLYNLFQPAAAPRTARAIAYSDFVQAVDADKVHDVIIQGSELTVTDIDASVYGVYRPDDPGLITRLLAHKVRVIARPVDTSAGLTVGIVQWLFTLASYGIWLWLLFLIVRALRSMTAALKAITKGLAALPASAPVDR